MTKAAGSAGNGKNDTRTRGKGSTTGKAHTGGRVPVDSETRARVVKLGRMGHPWTRNAIAREVGISTSTVSRICAAAEPPVTFDRAAIAAATEARTIDLKAKRTEISQQAIAEVQRLFGLLTAPHVVINWHEGMMSRGTIQLPTSGDVKNYATAIGILLDKHLVIQRHDADERDLPAVEQWLAAMGLERTP